LPSLKKAKVVEIISSSGDIQKLKILIGDEPSSAYSYVRLTGEVNVGDDVAVNTVARDLTLGTGGYDFVLSNLTNPRYVKKYDEGHIMKLRYTPVQTEFLTVEEQNSPYREQINKFESLAGLPVVLCPLHSMVAPVVATAKYLSKKLDFPCKISFIMTDSAALPLSISSSVAKLKDMELIDSTITIGQAFGGDFEAINIYTGLIAAKEITNSDLIVVSPGPGKVGTATKYGFSEIEFGHLIDAVNNLSGAPVFVPRINFSDIDYRHYGLSKHSVTILKEISGSRASVILPSMEKEKLRIIEEEIKKNNLHLKHDFFICDSRVVKEAIDEYNISLNTMGKTFQDDADYFKCAGAAGVYSVGLKHRTDIKVVKIK
jgi:hypothetical protein